MANKSREEELPGCQRFYRYTKPYCTDFTMNFYTTGTVIKSEQKDYPQNFYHTLAD